MKIDIHPDVHVTLESVEAAPDIEAPFNRPHAYRYHICIRNDHSQPIQLLGRKWLLRTTSGRLDVIEAEGLVGKKPHIAPGTEFRYQSFHLIQQPTHVTGSYIGRTSSGHPFSTHIPPFTLDLP